MKRFFLFLATALLTLSTAGCGGDDYDDAALKQQIAELEKRIAAAETVLNAYNNNLFIKSVKQTANGYIISFSDGSTATLTNGKDGADGDTWISNVVVGETEVTFTMTNGEQFTIPRATFVQQLQQIAYVPRYDDGQTSVCYTTAADSYVVLDFQLSPRELTADLVAKWNEYLSVEAVLTATRGVEVYTLAISDCTADTARGILTLTVSASNLGVDFFSYSCAAAAALVISDGKTTLSSEYVPLRAQKEQFPANQLRYTTTNGVTAVPISAIATGVTLTGNSYENGIGTMTFSQELTTIAASSFAAHKTLTSIEFPEGVTTIGSKAFRSCKSLFKAVIPASVTTIEESAFAQSVLTEVTILGRPTVGQFAFSNCKNNYGTHLLRAFYGPMATTDHRALVDTEGRLLAYAAGSGNSYEVPATVKKIGATAFANCDKFTAVTLPEGLTEIETYAFYYCYALTAIVVPEGVTTIGDYAFMGDRAITNATLPATLRTLGARAFGGCSALTTLTVNATTPPSLGAQAFASCHASLQIKVPASALQSYLDHEDWSAYAAKIVAQ